MYHPSPPFESIFILNKKHSQGNADPLPFREILKSFLQKSQITQIKLVCVSKEILNNLRKKDHLNQSI